MASRLEQSPGADWSLVHISFVSTPQEKGMTVVELPRGEPITDLDGRQGWVCGACCLFCGRVGVNADRVTKVTGGVGRCTTTVPDAPNKGRPDWRGRGGEWSKTAILALGCCGEVRPPARVGRMGTERAMDDH